MSIYSNPYAEPVLIALVILFICALALTCRGVVRFFAGDDEDLHAVMVPVAEIPKSAVLNHEAKAMIEDAAAKSCSGAMIVPLISEHATPARSEPRPTANSNANQNPAPKRNPRRRCDRSVMAKFTWPDELMERVDAMRLAGKPFVEIGNAIGRPAKHTATAHANWRRREEINAARVRPSTASVYVVSIPPPATAIEERDRRRAAISERNEAMAAQGNLSFLVGDLPPPGYSALDRMKGRVGA
ncbi:MAG: hypothetical protein WDN48_05840, partial [Pseudolabrys sp.]